MNAVPQSDERGAAATGILFSIVTPTFNCVAKIDATIQSVLAQGGQDWEYLLLDGGSNDGTLEKIQAYGASVRCLSEPDEGIYDAMNKGIRLASGRFIYFLGAGDRMQAGVLAAAVAEIRKLPAPGKNSRPTLLYGDVSWSSHRLPYDGPFNRFKLLRRNICHQAIFYERDLFSRQGEYDTRYPSLADWEFNMRCFNDRGITKRYVPIVVAEYEGNGASEETLDTAFLADFQALKRKHYGFTLTALMHLGFLMIHPGLLLREPWRQVQRWLEKRRSHRSKVP